MSRSTFIDSQKGDTKETTSSEIGESEESTGGYEASLTLAIVQPLARYRWSDK
jgi:hypothetical protein